MCYIMLYFIKWISTNLCSVWLSAMSTYRIALYENRAVELGSSPETAVDVILQAGWWRGGGDLVCSGPWLSGWYGGPPLNLSRPKFPHWKIEGILWRAPGHCLLIYNSILWQPFSKCAGRNPGDANQDSLRTELCYQTSWKSFIMVMHRSSGSGDAQYGGREGRETLAWGKGKPGMKIQAPRTCSLVLPHFWLRGRGWGGSHSLGRHVFKPFVQPEIETRKGPWTSSVQCSPSPLFGKLS